jgi:endothelin-converting enzyme
LDEMLAELQSIYPTKSGLVSGTQDHLTSAILYLMKSGVEALVSSGVTVS